MNLVSRCASIVSCVLFDANLFFQRISLHYRFRRFLYVVGNFGFGELFVACAFSLLLFQLTHSIPVLFFQRLSLLQRFSRRSSHPSHRSSCRSCCSCCPSHRSSRPLHRFSRSSHFSARPSCRSSRPSHYFLGPSHSSLRPLRNSSHLL